MEPIVKDEFDIDACIPRLSGHVTVQLIGVEGQVVQEVSGGNFIAPWAYEYFRRVMIGLLINGIPNNTANYWFPSDQSVSGIYLTSDTMAFDAIVLSPKDTAESPSTEYTVGEDNETIGYATRSVYTGSDMKWGSLSSESYARDGKARFVWTWANDKANGIIRSIELAKWVNDSWLPPRPGAYLGALSRTYTYMCEGAGFFWGVTGTSVLYKIDKTTMQEIGEFTLSVTISSRMLIKNGFMYFFASGAFYKWEIATTTLTVVKSTFTYGYSNGWAWIGDYIYYIYSSYYIARFHITTLVNEYKTTALGSISTMYALFGYSDKLHVVVTRIGVYNSYARVYEFDWAANAFTLTKIPTHYASQRETKIASWAAMVMDYAPFYKEDGTLMAIWRNNAWSVLSSTAISTRHLRDFIAGEAGCAGPLFSRKLLSTPIEKTSAFKLKVIYDLTW